MINEASNLRIASDFVNTKIAKKLQTIHKNSDYKLKEKLEIELKELLKIKEQINMGNYIVINTIIKKMGVK